MHWMTGFIFNCRRQAERTGLTRTAVFLLILHWAACENPFHVRDPEQPEGPSSGWQHPDSHTTVLMNLQQSILNRNVNNYMNCLVSPENEIRPFVFVPDPEVRANYPEVFAGWTRTSEESFVRSLFSHIPDDSSASLSFTDEGLEIITSDSTIIVRQYRLIVEHDMMDLAHVFEGQVEFWLREDSRSWWVIYYWADNHISGLPSWSNLKAATDG